MDVFLIKIQNKDLFTGAEVAKALWAPCIRPNRQRRITDLAEAVSMVYLRSKGPFRIKR